MDAAIRVEDAPGQVRVLTLSNPKKRNALDAVLLGQLRERLVQAASDGVRALLLKGEGDHFCSGYDLAGLHAVPETGPLPDDPLQEMLSALEALPAPTVAMVRGAAFGAGCELAAACDFRIFADDAVLCLPPVKLGVVYAPEGIARVSALIGVQHAKTMFLTGRRVPAAEAQAWGWSEALHPKERVEEQARRFCDELAHNAPLAMRGMKQIFRALARGPLGVGEAEHFRRVRREAFRSADAAEGRSAFLEKRAPDFRGK